MQNIRNASGQLIGMYEDTRFQLNLRNSHGVMMGWYNKSADRTFKANGQAVGTGNLLATLLS
jgi:hypothetical protein